MQSNNRFAALLLSACLASGHVVAEDLTLAQATEKTLAKHPILSVYSLRADAIQAQREVAALRPALEFGIEVENFGGTGAASGFDEAEITASLSSVIELGSKRSARTALADTQSGLLRIELQAQALDLLGAMTSLFINALSLKEQFRLAQEALLLSEETSETIAKQINAGLTPEAELLRAKARESTARISLESIRRELDVTTTELGVFWGMRTRSDFDVQGDLFNFGKARTFDELWELAYSSPAVKTFTSEERLRDAEIRLAESKGKLDIRWSVGIRRLEGLNENALVGSLQIPLNSARRNRGAVAESRARRAEVGVLREQALNQLYVRLYDAYETRKQSIAAVRRLREETIPALSNALDQTRSLFEAGQYSYLELIDAQRVLLDAKQTYIATASAALQAAVAIEQLTGISLQNEVGGSSQESIK